MPHAGQEGVVGISRYACRGGGQGGGGSDGLLSFAAFSRTSGQPRPPARPLSGPWRPLGLHEYSRIDLRISSSNSLSSFTRNYFFRFAPRVTNEMKSICTSPKSNSWDTNSALNDAETGFTRPPNRIVASGTRHVILSIYILWSLLTITL